MFEVAITKKGGRKSRQWTALAPTSDDLNVIVCYSKAVNKSFLIFLVHPRPQTIKQEIRVHIPCR